MVRPKPLEIRKDEEYDDDEQYNNNLYHDVDVGVGVGVDVDVDIGGDEEDEDDSYDAGGKSGLLSTPAERLQENLRRARRLLYISHAFAQGSEQAWQFAIILFLAAFCRYESMILVSTYGLTVGLSVCLFGAQAGRYVDSGDSRLSVARFFIWTENGSVLLATAFCYLLLHWQEKTVAENENIRPGAFPVADDAPQSRLQQWLYGVPLDSVSVALLICIHIFGPLAQIMDRGFLVAIERDWVVVMSQQAASAAANAASSTFTVDDDVAATKGTNGAAADDNDDDERGALRPSSSPSANEDDIVQNVKKMWLSDTNVRMRQIDLTAKIVAPALSGFLIGAMDRRSYGGRDTVSIGVGNGMRQVGHGHDLTGAALLVGLINILALIVEWICTARIYRLVPALADKQQHPVGEDEEKEQLSTTAMTVSSFEDEHHEEGRAVATEAHSTASGNCFCPQGLRVYLQLPISMAGLGLSLLYFNALSFGGLMTAYLVWKGMRLETIGIWRGVSSAIGLAGVFVYHYSAQHITLISTGMWSVTYQFACLSLSFGSLFVKDSFWSMVLLIGGVCTSRIGLWVFDLSVTQLMQELVPAQVRGVVGGTQSSLNAFFEFLIFGLALVFPDPNEFQIFITGGYAAVGMAMVLYAVGVFSQASKFVVSSEKATSRPS